MNLSTAFYPETDGQTERANQDIEVFLQAYTYENQDDWDRWLPMAEFADNNSIALATGLSPFFVNKGFHPRISFGPDPTNPTSTRESLQTSTAQMITDKMDEILQFGLGKTLTTILAIRCSYQFGQAYRLELPITIKIHNVFHPGLLRKAPEDLLPGQKNAPPPPVVVNGKEEWTVDEILDAKRFGRGKRLKYRVK